MDNLVCIGQSPVGPLSVLPRRRVRIKPSISLWPVPYSKGLILPRGTPGMFRCLATWEAGMDVYATPTYSIFVEAANLSKNLLSNFVTPTDSIVVESADLAKNLLSNFVTPTYSIVVEPADLVKTHLTRPPVNPLVPILAQMLVIFCF